MESKWRQAVREAMHQAADEGFVRQIGALPAFNYRWEHVKAVAELARRLAQQVGADEEVVEAAAWLHDVAKAEGENHPAMAADYARRFLAETDFPADKIDRVAKAIAQHKGLWREEPLTDLDSMVLWDADKLSKIGLTAAFHWTGMALFERESITTYELIGLGRAADWQSKTVDSMHTQPARRAAIERKRVFDWLWDRLESELRGDDLA